MNTRHEQEKKQFKQLFHKEGVDDFEKRFKVLDCFLKQKNMSPARKLHIS